MKEKKIQLLLGDWINKTYPDIIFKIDVADGMRLTIGQAMCAKRMRSRGKHCDLFLAFPNRGYHGFFLEIKQDRTKVFTKKGEFRKSEHLRVQLEMIDNLRNLGYYAGFGYGLEHCKNEIYFYLRRLPEK